MHPNPRSAARWARRAPSRVAGAASAGRVAPLTLGQPALHRGARMRRWPPGVFQASSSPRSTISCTDRTASPSRLATSMVVWGWSSGDIRIGLGHRAILPDRPRRRRRQIKMIEIFILNTGLVRQPPTSPMPTDRPSRPRFRPPPWRAARLPCPGPARCSAWRCWPSSTCPSAWRRLLLAIVIARVTLLAWRSLRSRGPTRARRGADRGGAPRRS